MKRLLCIGGPKHGEVVGFSEYALCLTVTPKQAQRAYDLSTPLEPPSVVTGTYWPKGLMLRNGEEVEVLVWGGWDR